MGTREEKKAQKRQRIITAARALFASRGVEGTSMRQIAREAGVATGTLFLYAPSKEALLLMAFSEGLMQTLGDALSTLDPEAPPVDQLAHLFQALLAHFDAQPDVARAMMKEIAFAAPTPGAAHPSVHGELLRGPLVALFERWREEGRVATGLNPMTAATAAFSLHFAHVILLLGRGHSLPEVTAHLRESLELLFQGCGPYPPTS